MNRGVREDVKDVAARAVDASAGTLCACCGDPERAKGRTICRRCVQVDCRLSTGCNRPVGDWS